MRRPRVVAAVEAMLRDARPRRFDADADEVRQLRVAALLHAAHPGTDQPRPEFVDALADRLRRQVAAGDSDSAHRPATPRRTFLRGAGVAAAAAAAGLGVDRLLLHPDAPLPDAVLVPDAGAWTRVASVADVRAVSALRFRAGAVEGVLVAGADGRIDGLSAVCTHMGCLLTVAARALECPCHRAHFTLDGTPLDREYLRPLPRLAVRVAGDGVEVHIA